MRKTVSIRTQARKTAPSEEMNAWVEQGAEAAPVAAPAPAPVVAPKPRAAKKEAMKRLSIDLPASVHKKLMIYCATNDVKAATIVRGLLEELLTKKK